MSIEINDTRIEIDASDVPNNPIQELIDALDACVRGQAARVWWHLEPDGYFLHFEPIHDRMQLRIDFAPESQAARSREILTLEDDARTVLLPFWRFIRNFQSGDYREPHWPEVDYRVLDDVRHRIKHARGIAAHRTQQETH